MIASRSLTLRWLPTPCSRLTRAPSRYHPLSHPETGRTHGSFSSYLGLAIVSPSWRERWNRSLNEAVGSTCTRRASSPACSSARRTRDQERRSAPSALNSHGSARRGSRGTRGASRGTRGASPMPFGASRVLSMSFTTRVLDWRRTFGALRAPRRSSPVTSGASRTTARSPAMTPGFFAMPKCSQNAANSRFAGRGRESSALC